MRVSILVLTFNEIEGMKVIMPRIKREWYDELVIIDGGSEDGTIEYAKQQGYPIYIQKQRGLGAAFMEGKEKTKGDIIVVLSPDGNSIPELIPHLVEKVKEGYDIVIASRYRDGAKSHDDHLVTAFGNRAITMLINLLFGAQITDSLVMYRAYRREAVDSLKIDTKGIPWATQVLTRAIKRELRIGEIPGDEPSRIGGVTKMHPLKNGLAELGIILKEFLIR